MRREIRYLQLLLTYQFYVEKVLLVIRSNRLTFLAFANPKLAYKLRSRRHTKTTSFQKTHKNTAFHTGKLLGINAVCSSFCRTCTDYARVLVLQHKNKFSKDMINYVKT